MSAAADTPRQNDKIERITTPGLIVGYLRRLLDSHSLLMVTVPGQKAIFSSILVAINENNNSIILDMLHPDSGHHAALQERQVKVRSQHNGVEMGFTMQIEQIVGEDDNPAYLGKLPAELLYHQRRSAYRAQIGAGSEIDVTISDADNQVIEAKLFNVSTGGMCLTVPAGMEKRFKQFAILPSCRFTTPDQLEIDTQVEVRNINSADDKKSFHVGVRFIDMDRQQQRHIQRFVLRLEREQIKRAR